MGAGFDRHKKISPPLRVRVPKYRQADEVCDGEFLMGYYHRRTSSVRPTISDVAGGRFVSISRIREVRSRGDYTCISNPVL